MSATPRLFVSHPLRADEVFEADADQSKYLARVMRLQAGDSVRVFNGQDGEWRVEIDHIDGRRVFLRPMTTLRDQPRQADNAPLLLFAPVKKAETDFIVEKATELGAAILQPVITEFTQTRTVRLDRLNKIALEAAEQTERLDLLDIRPATTIDDAIAALPANTLLIYCDESGDDAQADWGGEAGRGQPMAAALKAAEASSAAILVGPEGGFSPREREMLRQLPFCLPVSLGPRILRAETAVVAALTLWQALNGDWR